MTLFDHCYAPLALGCVRIEEHLGDLHWPGKICIFLESASLPGTCCHPHTLQMGNMIMPGELKDGSLSQHIDTSTLWMDCSTFVVVRDSTCNVKSRIAQLLISRLRGAVSSRMSYGRLASKA